MELEMILDDALNVLIAETLDQVELVLENYHTEENFPVLEFTLTELELSDFSHFFHDWLNLVLQIFIEGN